MQIVRQFTYPLAAILECEGERVRESMAPVKAGPEGDMTGADLLGNGVQKTGRSGQGLHNMLLLLLDTPRPLAPTAKGRVIEGSAGPSTALRSW